MARPDQACGELGATAAADEPPSVGTSATDAVTQVVARRPAAPDICAPSVASRLESPSAVAPIMSGRVAPESVNTEFDSLCFSQSLPGGATFGKLACLSGPLMSSPQRDVDSAVAALSGVALEVTWVQHFRPYVFVPKSVLSEPIIRLKLWKTLFIDIII